jgi:hypothetical protein
VNLERRTFIHQVRAHYSLSGRASSSLGAAVTVLALLLALMVSLPGIAFGQTVTPATPVATAAPTQSAPATASPTAQAGVSLSTNQGGPGTSVTLNGSGYRPGETVDVAFNGAPIGAPTVNTGGSFSLSFSIANLAPGQYGLVATGASSGAAAVTTFTVDQSGASLSFAPQQAAPGSSVIVSGSSFQPGDTVNVSLDGAAVGAAVADTTGAFSVSVTVPELAAGQYEVTANSQSSNVSATAMFTIIAATATAIPVATPAPAAQSTPAPAAAPAMAHDDRYFGQTGYRIENEQVWGFFSSYGGLETFGYPVSRTISFLGCPVQMFQRQIIQVCSGQGAALINLLDPDIFPYTEVNGSGFPAPDNTLKANTPPVSDPNYSANISTFIETNVPDTVAGQPVNFFQRFNTSGGLTIWGAPISNPRADPNNSNFVYQRFQRGIMHYIAGVGTESVLLADYLKAIITNQNVPPDLLQQSRESRFFNQYCPAETLGLCRPNELGGTDLTFAFVTG